MATEDRTQGSLLRPGLQRTGASMRNRLNALAEPMSGGEITMALAARQSAPVGLAHIHDLLRAGVI